VLCTVIERLNYKKNCGEVDYVDLFSFGIPLVRDIQTRLPSSNGDV